MTVKFNSSQLLADFDAARKRKRISEYRAALRCDLNPSTLSKLRSGVIQQITVTTMARMLHFIGKTDIEKYIYHE